VKQCITPEQLNELSDDQKERLREWWKPQKGDWFVACGDIEIAGSFICGTIDSYNQAGWCYEKKDCLPLLSIGQCIELLGAKLLHINHYHKQWQVSFLREQKEEELFITELYADDPIDALWQAVKEVL
jgi:hypothetical protein